MGNMPFRTAGRDVEIRLNRDVFSDDFINRLVMQVQIELIALKNRPEVPQEMVDEFVDSVQDSWWNSEGDNFIKQAQAEIEMDGHSH